MSERAVREVLARAAVDDAFRGLLQEAPNRALEPYRGRLEDSEAAALRSVDPAVLGALSALTAYAEPEPPPPGGRSWRPTNFKEGGALVLGLVLSAVFALAVLLIVVRMSSDPRAVAVGEATQIVDEFQRAKDFLLVVIPLFSAVIAYFLGVAVEGKRADENRREATKAGTQRDQAQQRELDAKRIAAAALARVKGRLSALQPGARAAGAPSQPDVSAAIEEIEEAERSIF